MRAPEFWGKNPGFISAALAPASMAYRAGAAVRRAMASAWRAPVPVICVGGIVAGGSGKTPATIALAGHLQRLGVETHVIASGYRGSFARHKTARRIDPARHGVEEAGDEALLLAHHAPTWVSEDRRECARAAYESGAGILLLDDGYQDPWIEKDLSILVVDGNYGFGNRRILPAGPLREKVSDGLGRADAVILVGDNASGVTASIPNAIPLLRAKLVPGPEAETIAGREVVAFAGIGDPGKFFRTLEELGCRLRVKRAFPDHHRYQAGEIAKLAALAEQYDALLVTTAKDLVRVPEELRAKIRVLTVSLSLRDDGALDRLLAPLLPRR
jgi:tetraacyldisaccharide 4'-kinase